MRKTLSLFLISAASSLDATAAMQVPILTAGGVYSWYTASGCVVERRLAHPSDSHSKFLTRLYRAEWDGECGALGPEGPGTLRRFQFVENGLTNISTGMFKDGQLWNGAMYHPVAIGDYEYAVYLRQVVNGVRTKEVPLTRDRAPADMVARLREEYPRSRYRDTATSVAERESNAQTEADIHRFIQGFLKVVTVVAQAKSDQYRNQTVQSKIRAEKDPKGLRTCIADAKYLDGMITASGEVLTTWRFTHDVPQRTYYISFNYQVTYRDRDGQVRFEEGKYPRQKFSSTIYKQGTRIKIPDARAVLSAEAFEVDCEYEPGPRD